MTLERKNTGRSFRLYYDHFQNRSKYIRDTDSVKCEDRVLSNRRICNVLNISTRHGPIRYAFISNSKWIPKRALSFPVSDLNTNTTFIRKLRKIHQREPGSPTNIQTQANSWRWSPNPPGGGERQKARLAHSTINRNDRP